jgi:tetraacyldisaccharide 4'-kinase
MTEYLVRLLKEKYRIAVLSRGYKRKNKGFQYVTKATDAFEVGDEAKQISEKFPDLTVAVCKDRIFGIKKLASEKNIELVILDDGFQYRKVKPQLSILLTEYSRPFFHDYFLPMGRLRDNKFESERADIIIVTKSPEDIKPIQRNIWRDNIELKPYQSLFFSAISYLGIHQIQDREKVLSSEDLRNKDILLVTGIANSRYLYEYIKQKAKKIHHIAYADHKKYVYRDIEHIKTEFRKIDSEEKIILTTEKDAVKLRELIGKDAILENFFYQEIGIKVLLGQEDELKKMLVERIKI